MTPHDILKPIHEWRADLAAVFAAEGVLRSYRRNAYVFLQGEPATAAYAIKSGRIEIFSVSAVGREVSISIREPGEIFGTNELVLGWTASVACVRWRTRSSGCCLLTASSSCSARASTSRWRC